MTGLFNSLKEKRAIFARELAYLHESVKEDAIDERMEKVEKAYMKDSTRSYTEAVEMVNEMPDSFEEEDRDELTKIMEATENLTFDEMIGIE